jgi:hypothetical protein
LRNSPPMRPATAWLPKSEDMYATVSRPRKPLGSFWSLYSALACCSTCCAAMFAACISLLCCSLAPSIKALGEELFRSTKLHQNALTYHTWNVCCFFCGHMRGQQKAHVWR